LIFSSKPRTAVYIDGFNLYYGALKGTPYKWIDLDRYFRLLRPNDDLQCIRYFTAVVNGPARPNQETYLRALTTTPVVTVILGKFKNKRVRCTLSNCSYAGDRFFQTPEEKRTDVNIAVHMLDDAYQNVCDHMLLVSGDSDLVPAVRTIATRFPAMQITVYVPARDPTRGSAVELRTAAHRNRDLPLNLLPHAQFPSTIPDGAGGILTKPASW
jgi:uncharacterized LabA/DUF88 family protein